MDWPAGVSKAGVRAVAMDGVEAGSWNEGIADRDLGVGAEARGMAKMFCRFWVGDFGEQDTNLNKSIRNSWNQLYSKPWPFSIQTAGKDLIVFSYLAASRLLLCR